MAQTGTLTNTTNAYTVSYSLTPTRQAGDATKIDVTGTITITSKNNGYIRTGKLSVGTACGDKSTSGTVKTIAGTYGINATHLSDWIAVTSGTTATLQTPATKASGEFLCGSSGFGYSVITPSTVSGGGITYTVTNPGVSKHTAVNVTASTPGVTLKSSYTYTVNLTGIDWPDSGNKSITITVSHNGSAEISEAVVLTAPAASASTITLSGNITCGANEVVTITRYDNSYTHTLTFKGVSTGHVYGTYTNVGTSKTVSTLASWANNMPTLTSESVRVICDTYSNGVLIGSNSAIFILSVPSYTPSLYVTEAALNDLNGRYVQNKSKSSITVTPANVKYGAYVVSYSITATSTDSYTVSDTNAHTYQSGVWTSSGSKTITVTLTDSRGKTATSTVSITVNAWTQPTITSFSASRSGTTLSVSYTITKSSVDGQNVGTAKVYINGVLKTTSTTTPASYTYTVSADTANTVVVRVTDSVGGTGQVFTVVEADYVQLNLSDDGLGVGIGTVAQGGRKVNVGWDLEIGDQYSSLGLKLNGKDIEAPTSFTITNGGSKDFNIPSLYHGMVLCQTYNGRLLLDAILSISNGTVYYNTLASAGTGITISKTTNKITVANSTGQVLYVNFFGDMIIKEV